MYVGGGEQLCCLIDYSHLNASIEGCENPCFCCAIPWRCLSGDLRPLFVWGEPIGPREMKSIQRRRRGFASDQGPAFQSRGFRGRRTTEADSKHRFPVL